MGRTQRHCWVAVLAAATLIAGCAGGGSSSADTGSAAPPSGAGSSPAGTGASPLPTKVVKDLVYAKALAGGAKDLALDIYSPDAAGPWPVAILSPGGYQGKWDMSVLARRIAEQGLVVYAPDFAHPDDRFAPPLGIAERMLSEQATCAIRMARSTAAEHGGSPDRVTWTGISIGGIMGFDAALADPGVGPAWDAFVATNGGPPSQFDCVAADASTSTRVDALVTTSSAFGQDLWPDTYADDPALRDFVAETYRPTNNPGVVVRMINGTADEEVAYAAAKATAERLEAAGIDVELTTLEGMPHTRNDAWLIATTAEVAGP